MFLKKQLGINVKERDTVRVDSEINKLSKNIYPYACAIRAKNQFFNSWKTLGHIPKEISRRVEHFIKTECIFVNCLVIPTKYHSLSISSCGLEIPLLFKFSFPEQKAFEKIKHFLESLYGYEYSGVTNPYFFINEN